ncbi:MalY/PatB family protein [Nocardia sp. CS682]|uniref:MalY/PatB family protein n=1 Tax=Nocardia sp. CS682 TaxID=1047172 RepID=UPI001F0E405B|nr:aminotransferase class I/II-fold pyridoxal phosphate-dependent enzyme [Nocardia sp. CS682]
MTYRPVNETDLRACGLDRLDLAWLRRKTGVKWARVAPDVLPAWIADMDFPVAPPVLNALTDTLKRGDLGYPAWSNWMGPDPLAEDFTARMALYQWAPEPDWVRSFSDIIQAIQIVIQTMTEPGDGVVVQTPSYPPFLKTVTMMGRRAVADPIERTDAGWSFDLQRLRRTIARERPRVLIIVNPHNPTGRVFTRTELEELAEIAITNDMVVVADEVLADLAFAPHRHIPIASLSSEIAARTITMTSATKAFNFAGLRCAVTHIGPVELRDAIDAAPPDVFGVVNVLGIEATKAAWRDGDDWLDAVRNRLRQNRDIVCDSIVQRMPTLGCDPPEANYLLWLDCGRLQKDDPALFFRDAARVELSTGKTFGPGCGDFVRLNFATAPGILAEILNRMTAAVAESVHTGGPSYNAESQ